MQDRLLDQPALLHHFAPDQVEHVEKDLRTLHRDLWLEVSAAWVERGAERERTDLVRVVRSVERKRCGPERGVKLGSRVSHRENERDGPPSVTPYQSSIVHAPSLASPGLTFSSSSRTSALYCCVFLAP